MQRLLCPREPALLLSRAELHSKGCWVSIQLIPGTLWQQGQEIDVSVPSPMPFLPQHPLLPPILHPLSIIPEIWEVEKGLSKGVASQLARGWSSCSFISQAWRFPPDALLEAAELSFLLSLARAAVKFSGKSSFLNLLFPKNAPSPQVRGIWGDFLSPLDADPAHSQGRAFALVLK